jgi:hypothetical protein
LTGQNPASSTASAEALLALHAAQPATKSLYERLGGVYSIATVVDDFIERLLVNDTLNANPAISEARGSRPKAGLKFPRHRAHVRRHRRSLQVQRSIDEGIA